VLVGRGHGANRARKATALGKVLIDEHAEGLRQVAEPAAPQEVPLAIIGSLITAAPAL
jgi:hypothetical protein